MATSPATVRSFDARRRVRGQIVLRRSLGVVVPCGVTGAWQTLCAVGLINRQLVPAPSDVVRVGVSLVASSEFGDSVAHTMLVTMVGWACAGFLGIIVGLTLGLRRTPWAYTMATLEVLRAIPAIAFLPLTIVILGLSTNMELVIVVYVAWFPVLVSTIQGVRSVPRAYYDLAATSQMSRKRMLTKVVLPATATHIIVGLRLALALALGLSVAAEVVGNPKWIGYEIMFWGSAIQPAKMLWYVIVIGVIGYLLNALFVAVTRRLAPGIARVSL